MLLLRFFVDSIKEFFSDRRGVDRSFEYAHEGTPLGHGGGTVVHRSGTVVHHPPAQKKGCHCFSWIWEKWSVIDSLYFATITFTSVGYGDITPDTEQGRLFTFFFGLYGIFILGFFAGIVGEKIVEAHNHAILAAQERSRKHVTNMFGEVEPIHAEPEKTLASIIWRLVKLEFPLICAVITIGVLYGVFVEGWTVVQSIYFAGITASTVGYGDFSPREQWSRLICVFLIPLCVVIFCEVLGRIAGAYLDFKIALQEKTFLDQQITLSDLDKMDTNRDGEVEWGEFLVFMLTAMQKVDDSDFAKLRKVFDKLDANGTGKLDKLDVLGARRGRS
ncbi:ion channel [Fragilaria crotonensis]|nr:ion channel [Fragilaria crotonensis]